MIEDDVAVAFPEAPTEGNDYEGRSGMSLRDYFAAKALQGMLAAPMGKFAEQVTLELVIRDAYVAADAMIRGARK